jgi:hypothetical protein
MDLRGSEQIYTKFRDRKQKLLSGEVTLDCWDTEELVGRGTPFNWDHYLHYLSQPILIHGPAGMLGVFISMFLFLSVLWEMLHPDC